VCVLWRVFVVKCLCIVFVFRLWHMAHLCCQSISDSVSNVVYTSVCSNVYSEQHHWILKLQPPASAVGCG